VYGSNDTCAHQGNPGSIVHIGRNGVHAYGISSSPLCALSLSLCPEPVSVP
jgi:hypothetical protein